MSSCPKVAQVIENLKTVKRQKGIGCAQGFEREGSSNVVKYMLTRSSKLYDGICRADYVGGRKIKVKTELIMDAVAVKLLKIFGFW